MTKSYTVENNKSKIYLRIVIVLLIVLLIIFLVYAFFYNEKVLCNAEIEALKLSNCTYECNADCVIEGFPSDETHDSLGEKIFIYEENKQIIKETRCVCACKGCRG